MVRPLVSLAFLFAACSANNPESPTETPAVSSSSEPGSEAEDDPAAGAAVANVTGVAVSGGASNYTFAVTLESPDTGCDQYANWWEVLDEDGALLYRRILGHSHVDEQPFTRTGGPVEIAADQVVFVRAHMDPGGYGGEVFSGSASAGFERATNLPTIDAAVESADPQPTGCAF
jgi:hypothetical protein